MSARCLIATSQTWPSTATLPGLLAQAGARIATFSPGPLGLSGYVDQRVRCSREPRAAATALRRLLSEEPFDWVIVGDEMLLRALLEHGEPASWLPVDPSDRAAVELVLSKHAFVERAADFGIAIPDSLFAATLLEAMDHAKRIGYPVVVKGDHGFGGSEVRICPDAQSLTSASVELFACNARIVVQRCLSGARISACVLYDRGLVAAYKAYRAECCFPDTHSASTVHAFFEHKSIAPVARALGKATGFHGLAGIDFMTDGSDDLYALEMNPRPTIGFAGTSANRAFFSPALRRLLQGETVAAAVAYDGRAATQSYFPGYLLYFTSNFARRDPLAWRRFFACLGEARALDAGLAAWEISRYFYDGFGKRFPDARTAVQRARAAGEVQMHAMSSADPVRSVP